jgi:vacuolar-type H+-ATPase subunit E/Vma4
MSRDSARPAALEPLRLALLAAATREADRELAAATADADARLAAAEAESARIRAEARDRARAEAALTLARLRAHAHARARSSVLAAQRAAYESLRRAARSAVVALRHDPAYPALRERMTDAVRRRLGPDAQIEEATDGGVVGRADARRVDYSLTTLADRVVDEIAAELVSS